MNAQFSGHGTPPCNGRKLQQLSCPCKGRLQLIRNPSSQRCVNLAFTGRAARYTKEVARALHTLRCTTSVPVGITIDPTGNPLVMVGGN